MLARALRAIPARTPLSLVLVALIGVHLGYGEHAGFYLLTLLALLLCALHKRAALLLLCVLAAGLAAIQRHHLHETWQRVHEQLRDAPELRLRGTLVRVSSYSAFLELEHAAPVKVELRTPHPDTLGQLGDLVEVEGVAYEAQINELPGRFDRPRWLRTHAVACSVEVVSQQVLGRPFSWAMLRGEAARWRERLVQHLIAPQQAQDARRQVLAALVLGERGQAEQETLELFQWSGSLHAFAVSGLHVGLVAGFLWLLLRVVRVPSRCCALVVLVLTGAYILLTGMAVSSLRAYLMMSLFLLGFVARRQVSPMNLLSGTALITLLIDPLQLHHAGFLLSFVVYAAILAAMGLTRHESGWIAPDAYIPIAYYTRGERRRSSWDRALRGTLLISAAAWLGSLPLMMGLFGSWNALGMLTNILITPLLPLVMGSGLLLLLCAPVPWLGALVDAVALECAGWLLAVVGWAAALPGAYLPTQPPAEEGSFMVMDLGFGKSATMLGNGGLLLMEGNETSTRWRVRPALFSSGYEPRLALALPASRDQQLRLDALRALWPRMQSPTLTPRAAPRHFHTAGNEQLSWTLYPAQLVHERRASADDRAPLVLWRAGGSRLLYIGNASAATLDYWRAQGVALEAESIILGYNNTQPILDVQWLLDLGAQRVILLPAFPAELDGIFTGELSLLRAPKRGAFQAEIFCER